MIDAQRFCCSLPLRADCHNGCISANHDERIYLVAASSDIADTLADLYERWDLAIGLVAVVPSVFAFFAVLGIAFHHPLFWYFVMALLTPAIGFPFWVLVHSLRSPLLQRWLLRMVMITGSPSFRGKAGCRGGSS